MQTTLLLNGGTAGNPDYEISADPWPALAAALQAGCTIAGGLGPDGVSQGVYVSGEPIRFFDFAAGKFADTALSGVPAWHDGVLYALDPAAGTICTEDGALALDTPVVRGVSLAVADADHDGLADLLVSDVDGRVWFYKASLAGAGAVPPRYTLQHKVWGGSCGGFAEGLRIAAIDWNGDGNLDAVGATESGTLVMLRDPRVGIPANLRIAAGLTSVVLEWDPSTQSRVRGYRVYRGSSAAGDFAQFTSPWTPLPAYRDYPETLQDWWYRVTSVGRFYTSGNSAPTFIESAPTEAQVAHLGGVELFVRDANGTTGQEAEVMVAINNSLGMAAKDLSLALEYDPALLEPRRVLPSGLTEAVDYTHGAADGAWRIDATGGTVDPGAGTLFTLVFYVKPQHVADRTTLSITAATAKSVTGQMAAIPLPATGTLSIFDSDPPVKPAMDIETCVREVAERETVSLPVVLSTDRTLDASTVRIEGNWNTNRLEFVRIETAAGYEGGALGDRTLPTWQIVGTAGAVPAGTNAIATLVFRALDVEEDTRSAVPVTAVAARSTAGVSAAVPLPAPFVVRILDNPAYDPVHATFLPGSASAKVGTEAVLPVAVQIDAALDGAEWSVYGSYDETLLEVAGATPLASGLSLDGTFGGGAFTVRGTGGTLPAKATAQPLFALRVTPAVQYETRRTDVAFAAAQAKAADGRVFKTALGTGGAVAIHFSDTDEPPEISIPAAAAEVFERREVSVPVRIATSDALDRGRLSLTGTWDADRLEFVRFDAAEGFAGEATRSEATSPAWTIAGTAGVVPAGPATLGSLVFLALDVVSDTQTQILVAGGAAVSTEGVEAAGIPAASLPVTVRNDPAFDPIHATFAIDSATAEIESVAIVKVSATFDRPMDGATFTAKIAYDAALLAPEAATSHVNGFSLAWSASGGVLTVSGTGGTIPVPDAKLDLFTVSFRLAKQQTTHSTALAFASVGAKSADGRTYVVDAATGGSVSITWVEKARYFKGDVNGDGDLDGDDVRYMQKLVMGSVKPTTDEIRAGDFNGDGKLTTADYTLLRKYFADLGISNR